MNNYGYIVIDFNKSEKIPVWADDKSKKQKKSQKCDSCIKNSFT